MTKRVALLLVAAVALITPTSVQGESNNATTMMTHVVSCDLECSNGGYCTLIEGTEAELAHQAQSGHLIEVCVCRPGFTGVACENIVEQCSLPERVCHNGVPCRQTTPDGEWSCDCSIAESLSNFAGRMCHNPITEYCTGKFDPDAALSFCTNGGRCLADFIAAKVAPGDTTVNSKYKHAGCKCGPEFYGPHCEFLKLNVVDELSMTGNNVRTNNQKVQRPATAILMSMMTASLLLVGVVTYRQRQRRTLSSLSLYPDSDGTFSSGGTFIENSIVFTDDGFESWMDRSDSQLPTVLETVVL